MRQIIEKDGPLTKGFLFQLYVKGCPSISRIGRAVKSTPDKLLRSMERAGEILIEDELRDGSPQSKVIRLAGTPKVRERPAGHRDLLEIPASEIFLALDRIQANSSIALDDETLMRRLLEHYKFSRLTAPRRNYLEKILKVWRQI